MDNFSRILVIYHANCADGFTAAWAVWKRFGDHAEFHAASYGSAPPEVAGRDVVIVDFSYKRQVLKAMRTVARSVLVLDHHKSAAIDLAPSVDHGEGEVGIDALETESTYEDYDGIRWPSVDFPTIYALFDMNRSGAGIAWDYFHAGQPRPALVNYVEDRDLWRFSLPGTRGISAAIFSYEYAFDVWDNIAALLRVDPQRLVTAGDAIERKHHKDIAELVKVCARRMEIGGFRVPVASLPYTMTSDAGHLMAQGEPFAACYWDTADSRNFSLRSTDDGADVSLIAAQYGGGGHRNAAGFKVPRDHRLALI
jgi:uncharacterized protein